MQVSIHEAKMHLSRLLNRAAAGEEGVIARRGKPVARLTPYEGLGEDRKPGRDVGRVRIAEDFDAPLPEAVLRDFEG